MSQRRGRPPNSERSTSREGEGRRRRVPLGGTRLKLNAKIPDGFVGRWINDEDNRINFAIDGGWQFMKNGTPVGEGPEDLNTNLGDFTSQIVGTKPDGSPLTAYLMVIKKEWYEEDQREKLKPVYEIEAAIKGGKVGQDAMNHHDRDKTYIPERGRGIKIS